MYLDFHYISKLEQHNCSKNSTLQFFFHIRVVRRSELCMHLANFWIYFSKFLLLNLKCPRIFVFQLLLSLCSKKRNLHLDSFYFILDSTHLETKYHFHSHQYLRVAVFCRFSMIPSGKFQLLLILEELLGRHFHLQSWPSSAFHLYLPPFGWQVALTFCGNTSHLQCQTPAWAPAPPPPVSAWEAAVEISHRLHKKLRTWTLLLNQMRKQTN